MLKEIHPLQVPDACGNLLFLDPENCARYEALLGELRAFEHIHFIQRVRAPVIMDAPGDADMVRYKQVEGASGEDPKMVRDEAWRLVRDPWKDTLELAAAPLMRSYRDLGALSTVAAVYYQHADAPGLQQKTLWVVACYGLPDSFDDLIDLAVVEARRLGAEVVLRSEMSSILVRGKTNEEISPKVTVMEAILLDSLKLRNLVI